MYISTLLPTHDQYRAAVARWTRIRDALAGSEVIKSKGQTYLPALEEQEPDEYASYLYNAVFFNVTERTLNSLIGSLFRKSPEINGLPKAVKIDSITKDGQSLQTFMRTIANEVIPLNRYGVLVDKPSYPSLEPSYMVGYCPEDILNWRRRVINGKLVLDQVILRERYDEPNIGGYGSAKAEVYRILELDADGYYFQKIFSVEDHQLRDPIIVYPRMTGELITEIPFKIFSVNRSTPDIQKPTFQEIVELNLSHYRSYADLEYALHICAIPVYYMSGVREGDNYVVSPRRLWTLNDKDDKIGILEFNGRGLDYCENGLLRKEQHISSLGGKLLSSQRKQAAESSEVVQMREKGEQSVLLNMANSMGEAFTELLKFKCKWDGYEAEDLLVSFNKDFSEGSFSSREARVLQQIAEAGIPTPLAYKIFQSADAIPDDMTREEFEALLESYYKEHRKREIEDIKLKQAPKMEQALAQDPAKADQGSQQGRMRDQMESRMRPSTSRNTR